MEYKRLRLSDQKLELSDFDEKGQQMVSFLDDCHVLYKAAYIDINDLTEIFKGENNTVICRGEVLYLGEVFAGLYIPHLDKLLPVGLARQPKSDVNLQLKVDKGRIIIEKINHKS